MKALKRLTLRTVPGAIAALPVTAWAHPGHEHSHGWLAQVVHSVTGWGPLLVVLVVAVAAGYQLWKSKRR